MARSSECTEQYAQKVFDSAGIVREAMFRQLTKPCGPTRLSFPYKNLAFVLALRQKYTTELQTLRCRIC